MSSDLFEVLSPWAEADPIPAKGINPRMADLAGKKIGLFRNVKRAAQPMSDYLQAKLKSKYPGAEIIPFCNYARNEVVTNTPGKEAFEEWVKSVDTVVTMVGD